MHDLPRVRLPVDSVEELLALHADKNAQKTAIIAVDVDTSQTTTISYHKLYTLIHRAAVWLTALGIARGDRLAILMPNTPEVIILELAGALIGAATVPLDAKKDTPDRKIYKLKDTGAKLLLIKTDSASRDSTDAITEALPHLNIQTWATMTDFDQLLPQRATSIRASGTMTDHYVILYTSGTTALPKGVLLSLQACLYNAMGIVDWQKLTQHDVFNIVLPLHHINSTEFCLAMIIAGGTIILNSRYSAGRFWQIVSAYRVTHTSIVPTILHDLLARAHEFKTANPDVSSLRRICIGSAPVLPEETMRFYDTFAIRVTQGYGQTETALRVAGVPIEVSETHYKKLVRCNTIGCELANNHLAIMDNQNNTMPEGKEGEICISGPVLADGYLNNREETEKAFLDGWFHSGDLGYWKRIDGEVYYFIIGRIKEIIIKGGVNLSPSAIEDALLKTFPEVDEVSVVGYPDARMGEEIAAAVTLRNKLGKLDKFVQLVLDAAQNGKIPGLSRYEVPKKFFVFDHLPKTSTGKIQRVEVKKSVAELIKKEHHKHYVVRQISADEKGTIKKALEINNARFPFVPSLLKEFVARAKNGFFFGVFEEQEGLIGTLSCVQLKHSVIEKIRSWKEATNNGTLANNDPSGDSLVCVAISVATSNNTTIRQYDNKKLKTLAKKYIKEYVNSDNDHVLNFHKKPKGGLPGATVWKIIENGRPEDEESMGYNVLMKYPVLHALTTIVRSHISSPSVLLIQHALHYAKKHGIQHVIAFSRPAGFGDFLQETLRV